MMKMNNKKRAEMITQVRKKGYGRKITPLVCVTRRVIQATAIP